MNLGSSIGIVPADGETTGRRIRINRPDDENARCKVSRAPGQRKDFYRRVPPRFKQLTAYGSYVALAVCLFGLAWAGWYSSSGPAPQDAIQPPPAVLQKSVGRTETQMAEDIRALKASVEALRAAQSQSQMDATALEGLKSRLDAVKTKPPLRSPKLRISSSSCNGNPRRNSRNFSSGLIALNIRSRGPLLRHRLVPLRSKEPRVPGSRRKWPPRFQSRQPNTNCRRARGRLRTVPRSRRPRIAPKQAATDHELDCS